MLNSVVTGVIILAILWLALRSVRLVVPVVVNLAVGLVVTAGGGILMVGALNPISLAFAVLFVGLGADFAIQYTIRYREERHETENLDQALARLGQVGRNSSHARGGCGCGRISVVYAYGLQRARRNSGLSPGSEWWSLMS